AVLLELGGPLGSDSPVTGSIFDSFWKLGALKSTVKFSKFGRRPFTTSWLSMKLAIPLASYDSSAQPRGIESPPRASSKARLSRLRAKPALAMTVNSMYLLFATASTGFLELLPGGMRRTGVPYADTGGLPRFNSIQDSPVTGMLSLMEMSTAVALGSTV